MNFENHILMTKYLLLHRNHKMNKEFLESAIQKQQHCIIDFDIFGRAFYAYEMQTLRDEQNNVENQGEPQSHKDEADVSNDG